MTEMEDTESRSANQIIESLAKSGERVRWMIFHQNGILRFYSSVRSINHELNDKVVCMEDGAEYHFSQIIMAGKMFVNNPLQAAIKKVEQVLRQLQNKPASILEGTGFKYINVDLSIHNPAAIDGTYAEYIFDKCSGYRQVYGIGGYAEDRPVYAKHALFGGEEPRTIHLGWDVWAPSATAVIAPFDGVVFGVADNTGAGNYGPTIILKHSLQGVEFYTLYGHLSRESLKHLKTGSFINAGQVFCQLGTNEENGYWYPHLHFQLMSHVLDNTSDFPGVAAKSEAWFWLGICVNPSGIYQLDGI
jgi:murein DD-endopeptidase MepM/ murein hydrolase activator NlpD